ncbi:MAG: protein kinase [Anaerolineae bacterium]|nr:protein kinase [Anaerolineae bacterium]
MPAEAVLNQRYELIAQQGSGGMSVIYRAVDRLLGRTVAIKVLRPSLTSDPAFLEKFQQEARSIANLTHPNIVTVYDVGRDVGAKDVTHYIVMEMVDGQDLKKIIKAGAPLPVDRVIDLSIQIAAGLGYAHRSGLVHADVKPQNILVTPTDVVKVTDFGIAQALTDTQPQQRVDVVWGSPHYFAPEQARGEQPGPAADVYAIGIVMFEMLTGRLPYSGASQQELALAHIKERIPMVTEFNPTVPEALAKIVFKLMSKEPGARYRMAGQLEQILTEYRDKSREYTVRNANMPGMPAAPGLPTVPSTPPVITPGGIQPPQSRPPGVGLPPAAPPASEPTARFSAAPAAPQPYHPRQPGIPAAPGATTPPQPLEQRYSVNAPAAAGSGVPMPPAVARGDSGAFAVQYGNSQPIREYEEDEGPDYVTIALAVLAIIAVLGLCPLYLAVLSARF